MYIRRPPDGRIPQEDTGLGWGPSRPSVKHNGENTRVEKENVKEKIKEKEEIINIKNRRYTIVVNYY